MNRRKQKYSSNLKTKREVYREKQKTHSPERITTDYRRIRILQKNLVYVIGLTETIAVGEILESNLYFGRYGKVVKTIVNKSQTNQRMIRNANISAYITYETELQASLAIIALDNFKIGERPLKVSYGATKYCSYFTKNQDCPSILQCCYLHNWQVENEITVTDQNSKQVFVEQINTALEIVFRNIDLIIIKKREKQDNNSYITFPRIEVALHTLVVRGLLTDAKYNSLFGQSIVEEQLLNATCMKDERKKVQQNLNQESSEIKKSSSLSTMHSPTKSDQSSQISTELDPNTIQELLERSLIRSVMNQNSVSRSKLSFVSEGNISDEEEKIKNYVQRFVLLKKN